MVKTNASSFIRLLVLVRPGTLRRSNKVPQQLGTVFPFPPVREGQSSLRICHRPPLMTITTGVGHGAKKGPRARCVAVSGGEKESPPEGCLERCLEGCLSRWWEIRPNYTTFSPHQTRLIH